MTGINHGMTGAVIALTVKNPLLAVPLAFASHFAQDILPHWDYNVRRSQKHEEVFFTRLHSLTLLADFLIAVAIMVVLAFMFPLQKWLIWGCMIAAAAPDLMWSYYRLYLQHYKHQKPKLDPLAKLHARLQSFSWSHTRNGFFVEAAWFILTSITILKLR